MGKCNLVMMSFGISINVMMNCDERAQIGGKMRKDECGMENVSEKCCKNGQLKMALVDLEVMYSEGKLFWWC